LSRKTKVHHVPAFTFEQILKRIHAKYIYGLTATPARRDGHHPIIFMHCGPVRYRADDRKPKYRPGIAERPWKIDQRLIAWMTKPSFY